jgi:hypothetical protein
LIANRYRHNINTSPVGSFTINAIATFEQAADDEPSFTPLGRQLYSSDAPLIQELVPRNVPKISINSRLLGFGIKTLTSCAAMANASLNEKSGLSNIVAIAAPSRQVYK